MTAQTPLIVVLTELRKTVRALVLTVCLATLVIFFLTPRLLQVVQSHLSDKLYFFAVAEPFLAHVKLALFGAVYGLIPWIMTVFWRAMAKPFKVKGIEVFFFVLFTCLLFYAGTLFCYFITLPFGVKFLLGFGSEQLRPVISVSKFVNFTTIFILAFGVVFELPIFMVFLAKVGVCSRQFFAKHRRVAMLIIAVLAALLTPTPDIVNMLLMGGPLYLLYEAGIVILMVMRIK